MWHARVLMLPNLDILLPSSLAHGWLPLFFSTPSWFNPSSEIRQLETGCSVILKRLCSRRLKKTELDHHIFCLSATTYWFWASAFISKSWYPLNTSDSTINTGCKGSYFETICSLPIVLNMQRYDVLVSSRFTYIGQKTTHSWRSKLRYRLLWHQGLKFASCPMLNLQDNQSKSSRNKISLHHRWSMHASCTIMNLPPCFPPLNSMIRKIEAGLVYLAVALFKDCRWDRNQDPTNLSHSYCHPMPVVGPHLWRKYMSIVNGY